MKNGPTVVYIFGYEKQYPIAKIENATYLEVATALGITPEEMDAFNESNISSINSLRTMPSFTKAMITTYNYQPLVGITSVTDPKGNVLNYHYDAFNRLEFVKDKEDNILKEHKYNYKTNP